MEIEVSIGEIVDKITILSIKSKKIKDKDKLINIKKELDYLVNKVYGVGLELMNDNYFELQSINEQLWDIEDAIREKENKKEFDSEFIELARSVYITNDKRFQIKNKINIDFKSGFREEKSYKKYS
jgi:hypothetical protein